jgi:acyl transferase domain-containing protein
MSEPSPTHIAIIGMASRFGDATDLDAYWQIVRDGAVSVRTLTTEELLAHGETQQRISNPGYVPRHAPLVAPEWFDAEFFGFSPLDADITDPQQRVFLEACWQALETAGYPPTRIGKAVGVYGGSKVSRYGWLVEAQRERLPAIDGYRIAIATDLDHLCLRVSHRLCLTGPSITIMTTCSTSLVAVHQACQALLAGECEMALAGGVMVRMPLHGSMSREGGVISPDGVCRPFDADANGTIGGDGVGVVVLKRLAEAIVDGDSIQAVIRGSAVNNDGGDRPGYHASSVSGQAAVIQAAHAAAEVDPSTVDHVQTHGTATYVGDPVEIAALTRAFARSGSAVRDRSQPRCVLGAVKSNVGHTDAAAGVAGLIAAVMALRTHALPPIANYQKPNPEIDFDQTPFTILTEATPWEDRGHPRRAGVSSFGMGGTNAHVVLEEAPPPPVAVHPSRYRLLVLAARTPAALEAATGNLAEHLRAHPELSLDDVAYTLQVGRVPFQFRRFAVVTDQADAAEVLSGRVPDRLVTSDGPCQERPVLVEPGHLPEADGPVAPDLLRHLPALRDPVSRTGTAAAALTSLWQDLVSGIPGTGDPIRYTVDTRVTLRELLLHLGNLWVAGGSIRWQPLHAGQGHRRVPLPTYPFQRRRHVVDLTPSVHPSVPAARPAPAATPGSVGDSVATLFEEVLGTAGIGWQDDFFQLGGDSLVAAQLAVRLEDVFGVAVPLDAVFDHPTPAGLADEVMAIRAGQPVTELGAS